ncbi:MAG TPA: Crp/Fnr family transcriptional regulator [Puia sp.]|uniref:Crp/Fnr family transcriptional regulator n=1 Tax=Puia sp. TaxID=2045100 RepID=UPI002BDC0458|nr:Crp/Fnr family transcriptional regulator [Puia sp.]HVU95486.1 Crp/Fnr family transcriptional regulator [Puia sp.]
MAKRHEVRKGDVLLRPGEISQRLYFIKKGLLHCYYDVDGKPVSAGFFMENDTVVSVGSFYSETPSEDCLEAFEDGELYYIERDEFFQLCNSYPSFCFLALLLFIKYLTLFHDHARLIRKRRAEDRLRLANEKYPELFQRVAKKFLASWMGVERETLSRPTRKNRRRSK